MERIVYFRKEKDDVPSGLIIKGDNITPEKIDDQFDKLFDGVYKWWYQF
jgi:hypothetical protein